MDKLDIKRLDAEGQSLLCGSAREGLSPLVDLADRMGRDRWRVVSDVAQVVAYYLRCHPRVEAVRYPGVKGDPWFEEASHTLVGGFGPLVAFRVAGEWYQLACPPCDPRTVVMSLERNLVEQGTGLCTKMWPIEARPLSASDHLVEQGTGQCTKMVH